MTATDHERLRLAAGLLGVPEDQARAAARRLTTEERITLGGQIDWLLDYEAHDMPEAAGVRRKGTIDA